MVTRTPDASASLVPQPPNSLGWGVCREVGVGLYLSRRSRCLNPSQQPGLYQPYTSSVLRVLSEVSGRTPTKHFARVVCTIARLPRSLTGVTMVVMLALALGALPLARAKLTVHRAYGTSSAASREQTT